MVKKSLNPFGSALCGWVKFTPTLICYALSFPTIYPQINKPALPLIKYAASLSRHPKKKKNNHRDKLPCLVRAPNLQFLLYSYPPGQLNLKTEHPPCDLEISLSMLIFLI